MRLLNLLNRFKIIIPVNITRNYSDYAPKALRSLKGKSKRNTVQYYVDTFKVRAVGGSGGDGCISFLSVWCKDQAGPDGGDGGNGGHVIFQATHSVRSLNHIKAVVQAKHGEKGYNKDCNGKNSQHVVIPVPLGTIIRSADGRVVGDLSREGVMFVAARGGAGGRGNRFFLTDTEQAPEVAELGAVGENNTYVLELRSLAHVGLLGAPNAGKSTLLRAVSRARPAVAPYPFTTLKPHIGMVPYDDYEQVAIADLPGLVEGSHENRGLGIQFLQHVERCKGLIYLLDGTAAPLAQYATLRHELMKYNHKLTLKQNCVVINKIDTEEGRRSFEEIRDLIAKEVNVRLGRRESGGEGSGSDNRLEGNEELSEEIEVKLGKQELNDSDFSKREIGKENISKKRLKNKDLLAKEVTNDLIAKEIGRDFKVLGISAKTGINLTELLRVVRAMYDKEEGPAEE